MRVCDRKAQLRPKQPPCRRQERLAQNHRSNRERPEQPVPVVKRLCTTAKVARKVALVIIRVRPVRGEPSDEPIDCCLQRSGTAILQLSSAYPCASSRGRTISGGKLSTA